MVKQLNAARTVLRRVIFSCIFFGTIMFLPSCQTATQAATSDPQIVAQTSIRLYRSVISSQDDSRCVFTPTCSRYMEEAIQKHGIIGILMGVDRLTRCHGLNLNKGTCYEILKDGTLYDPVK